MYLLILTPRAHADIRSLPAAVRRAVGFALYQLQLDPSSGDVKKLAGSPYFRLRVGDYRVIYAIDHGKVIITVIRIDNRKDIYR